MPDPLPPDPDALEKWQQMPQNKPTKSALPPAAGGLRLGLPLLIVLGLLVILGWLLQGTPA